MSTEKVRAICSTNTLLGSSACDIGGDQFLTEGESDIHCKAFSIDFMD